MISSSDISGQEWRLETKLRHLIAGGAWNLGERLPAERRLAADLGVSRNTLRGVLRRLEAQGLVSIRKGSGCFLTSKEALRQTEATEAAEPLVKLMARFEAAYLFLPAVLTLAAERMESRHLTQLERCTTELGKAIVLKAPEGIKEKTRDFFQIIAAGTRNPVIVEHIDTFCGSCSIMFPDFFSFREEVQGQMFADMVRTMLFLQQKDPLAAASAIRKKVLNTAVAFSQLKGIPLSGILEQARSTEELG